MNNNTTRLRLCRTRDCNDLRLERRERGLTCKKVSLIIGKSVAQLNRYETGERLPTLITALKLQILYRSQLAGIYNRLYKQLTKDVHAREDAIRSLGKRGGHA
mgnify:CR=1 FL=1